MEKGEGKKDGGARKGRTGWGRKEKVGRVKEWRRKELQRRRKEK